MNLWEVAFNDLKQFARVDSEKQGALGIVVLLLKQAGQWIHLKKSVTLL